MILLGFGQDLARCFARFWLAFGQVLALLLPGSCQALHSFSQALARLWAGFGQVFCRFLAMIWLGFGWAIAGLPSVAIWPGFGLVLTGVWPGVLPHLAWLWPSFGQV